MSDKKSEIQIVSVTERHHSAQLSKEILELKNRTHKVNAKASEIANTLLENIDAKTVDSAAETLTKCALLMKDLQPKSKNISKINSILSKLPFYEKIKKSIDKTVVENSSAKTVINGVFESLDASLNHMNKNYENLASLMDTLDASQKDTNALIEEIDTLLPVVEQDKKRRSDLLHLRSLRSELLSIQLINKKTADNIENQLNVSEMLTLKISESSPLLKDMVTSQSALGASNRNNENVRESFKAIQDMINLMVIDQQKQTHDSLVETIKLSNSQIIKQQTLIDLKELQVKQANDLRKVIIDTNKDLIDYQKTQQDSINTLMNNSYSNIVNNALEYQSDSKQKESKKETNAQEEIVIEDK